VTFTIGDRRGGAEVGGTSVSSSMYSPSNDAHDFHDVHFVTTTRHIFWQTD
jgi:hypothetical protein